MGLKGIILGAWAGSFFGGPLGALIGAALGHKVEGFVSASVESSNEDTPRNPHVRRSRLSAEKRAMIFAASSAAILAKMAKADGRITADEIACVERVFARLGFNRATREYAINVFRRAKDDEHTIYEYAAEFGSAVDSPEVREHFYRLLWELADADGNISVNELQILLRIPTTLGIRLTLFEECRRIHGASRGYSRSSSRSYADTHVGSGNRTLAEAYELMGVTPKATDDEVKKAYREMAKKNHPDLLRAKGLPEEMVGRATERMKMINDAWSRIREARGL